MSTLILHPSLLRTAALNDLERLAIEARMHYLGDAAKSPWIDPRVAAQAVGFGISEFRADQSVWGAIAVEDHLGTAKGQLFLKPNLESFESAFIIAHLLGHFFLHIAPSLQEGNWQKGGFKEVVHPLKSYLNLDQSELKEWEASRFAASLLAPVAMLKKVLSAKENSTAAARFFKFPTQFVESRCAEINSPLVAPTEITIRKPSQKGMDRLREIARGLAK